MNPEAEDLHTILAETEKVLRWLTMGFLFLLLLLAVAATALAAPKARSAEECVAYADLALVAMALAKHGVAQEKTVEILPSIYNLEPEGAKEVSDAIVKAAYQKKTSFAKATEFANNLARVCMETGGNMDGVLGTSL